MAVRGSAVARRVERRPWVTGEPRSRGTGPDLAWVLVLEQQRDTAKLPGGSDRDGIERSRAPATARRRG